MKEQCKTYINKDLRWLPVVGYEGVYEVSENGDILSMSRIKSNQHGEYITKERLLKSATDRGGYKYVYLTDKQGYSRFIYVHRIVAQCFLEKDVKREFVNHINGIKTDNNYRNLEWVTKSENTAHAYSIGSMGIGINIRSGSKNKSAKLDENKVVEIKNLIKIGRNCFSISKSYNVNPSTIYRIRDGKSWKNI